MKNIIIILCVGLSLSVSAQNSCVNPLAFCNNFSYPNNVNSSSGTGANFGCLLQQPNPTWFYTKIFATGNIDIQMSSSVDVDFVCWGPFSSSIGGCNNLGNPIACSYSPSNIETMSITNAIVGQYYIFMVTNFANVAGNISLQTLPSSVGIACANPEGIVGYAYNDANANCTLQNSDTYLKNVPFKLYDNNNIFMGMSYANNVGTQQFPYRFVLPAGTYKVAVDTVNIPFTNQCIYPGVDSLATLTNASPIDTINFSLKCKNGFDVGVQSIHTSGIPFPGMFHNIKIRAGDISQFYNLNCIAAISGQVVVNVAGPVSYVSPSLFALTPSIISGNSFTYTVNNFDLINNNTDFGLSVLTNTNAVIGDSVFVTVDVYANGDNNLLNNHRIFGYRIVNSYDPNIKETYPVKVMPGFNDWLTYTVHFQNTGNAAAQNVRILDTLSNHINASTFELLNYSHDVNTTLLGKVLNFKFSNIFLPDSATNKLASMGFVQYRVKANPTFVIGTEILNKAFIYFDYNAPIITNTTKNDYFLTTDLKQLQNNAVSFYPNPTNGLLNINGNELTKKMELKIYSVIGDVVYQNTIDGNKTQLDLNTLASGVYVVNIVINNKISTHKLIIQK